MVSINLWVFMIHLIDVWYIKGVQNKPPQKCAPKLLHEGYFELKALRPYRLKRNCRRIHLFFNYVGEFKFPLPQIGFPGGSGGKNLPAMQETWVQSLGWEDSLEEEMATHYSILAGEFHGQRSLAGYSP